MNDEGAGFVSQGGVGDTVPARGEKGGEKRRGDWSVFIVSVPGRK